MTGRSAGARPAPRGRRRAAGLLAALALASVASACSGGASDASPPEPGRTGTAGSAGSAGVPAQPGPTGEPAATGAAPPTPTPTPPPGTTAPPAAPPVEGPPPSAREWSPASTEVQPGIKQVAVQVLLDLARGVGPRGLRAQAAALVPPAAEGALDTVVTEVVYPQYGGLEDRTASVMAVLRQWWTEDGATVTRTATADVRLAYDGSGWDVSEVIVAPPAPARPWPGPVVPKAPAAGTPVGDLLRHPRVELPDAAQLDLLRGGTDPRVVDLLLGLAEDYEVSVSVLASGHPREVFGETYLSNHTTGRAVDIWRIDGVPVVEMSPESPQLRQFLTDARALGADSIGSPVDLDGPRKPGGPPTAFFTDALHRDHVHLAFRD